MFFDKHQTNNGNNNNGSIDDDALPLCMRLSQIYGNLMSFRGVMFMFRVFLIVYPHDFNANHIPPSSDLSLSLVSLTL